MSESEDSNLDALNEDAGLSPMDQDSIQMHEVFLSLMRAGFTERQALTLVGMIVVEADEGSFYSVDIDVDDSEDEDGKED